MQTLFIPIQVKSRASEGALADTEKRKRPPANRNTLLVGHQTVWVIEWGCE